MKNNIEYHSLEAIQAALKDVGYLLLTTGHPEFGIECTISGQNDWVTVVNQPDEISAIIEARRKYDAGEYVEQEGRDA